MANWTSTQDVLDRWTGSNLPSDNELIETLIADAEIVVLSEYPRIAERITNQTLSLDVVKFVVSRMVIRVLKNPENFSNFSRTTGPFSESRTFGQDKDIWLTDSEKGMLAPDNKNRASSVSLLSGSQKEYRNYIYLEETEENLDERVIGLDISKHAVDSENALADYNEILEENEGNN